MTDIMLAYKLNTILSTEQDTNVMFKKIQELRQEYVFESKVNKERE